MAELTTVFLSSTAKDLQPYRDAVVEAIGKLAGFHCTRMEDFGAVDAEPLEVCRRRVDESRGDDRQCDGTVLGARRAVPDGEF